MPASRSFRIDRNDRTATDRAFATPLLLALVWICLCIAPGTARAQSTIRVPQDHASIQAAINATVNGDTVLVSPGVYLESINFLGKGITVRSSGGANVTVIDANSAGAVVTFANGETSASLLSGFTVRNAVASGGVGAINIVAASPVISENVVAKNSGPGIQITGGAPVIRRNVIGGNAQGIYVLSAGSAEILENVIAGNTFSGIQLFAAGTPLIRGNVVGWNSSGQGGGFWIVNASDALILQNLIIGNSAPDGAGIHWTVPSGSRGPFVVNNTIADNDGAQGSGVTAIGYDAQSRLVNNIIIARPGQAAIHCDGTFDPSVPVIQFNNVHAPSGTAYGGICGNLTGTSGNLSADPLFADPARGNYRLTTGSPAIDAGSNAVADLPATDLDGRARITDGDANSVATIDMGAYEFTATPPPLTLSAATTALGSFIAGTSPVAQTVTLSNAGPGTATVALAAVASTEATAFALSVGGPTPCASLAPTLAAGTSCTLVVTFTPLSAGSKAGTLAVISDAVGSPTLLPFSATVLAGDTTPDPFAFASQTNVARSTVAISNTVTIGGLNTPTPVSIVGGEYSINGGAFTASPGTIQNGQTVAVRLTTSANYLTTSTATLTVGTSSAQFNATTLDPTSPYLPLANGNSWATLKNGVVATTGWVTGTDIVNGVPVAVVLDPSDNSREYYSNDANGVRLHRTFTPSVFIPGCGTVGETDTYSPITLIPVTATVGQTVHSGGNIIADLGACGAVQIPFTATSTLQAIERVSVPAGQFDALRVVLTLTVPNVGSISATFWFASGVGPVKSVDEEGTLEELASTNIVRTNPDAFAFAAQSNVAANSVVTSNAVAVSGITAPAGIAVAGGEYSINGAAFTSQPGAVSNGQSVRVRLTSSAQFETPTTATLTIGGVPATFTATTAGPYPTTPQSVSARAGDRSITVRFVAPASAGASAITGYSASCTSTNGGAPGSGTAGPAATSIVLAGLTNGKSYRCTVTASNALGAGTTSAPSSSVPFDITTILNILLDD